MFIHLTTCLPAINCIIEISPVDFLIHVFAQNIIKSLMIISITYVLNVHNIIYPQIITNEKKMYLFVFLLHVCQFTQTCRYGNIAKCTVMSIVI